MKIKELLTEGEQFTFFKYRFDIDLVRRHIEAGDVPYKKDKVNITAWAKQMLGLDREKPNHKPVSMMMRIDYDHLDKISDDRLKEPIFVVHIPGGALIIDGNHRVAKAYMAGIDELDAIVFDEKATKKLNTPVKVKTPRKKKPE